MPVIKIFGSLQETPLYFFLLFIFFTSLVDDALIIEYFMAVFGHQSHTTTVCQFLTFASIGNRLLQVRSHRGWLVT